MILTLLLFAGTILVLVGIHEGGHFFAAKLAGVYVKEFAIGFGPKLFSFRPGETRYAIRLMPLGGYVRMAGEDQQETDAEIPNERLLTSKPPLVRILISIAGPSANLLTTFLIAIFALWSFGTPLLQVGAVIPETPAAAVLQPGDRILSIDERAVYNLEEFGRLVQRSQGEPLTFLVERNGEERPFTITPTWQENEERYVVGGYFWYVSYTNQVMAVIPDSAFARAGVKPGDRILSLAGGTVATWIDLVDRLNALLPAEFIPMRVQREAEILEMDLPTSGLEGDELLSGVEFTDLGVAYGRPNFLNGLTLGAGQFADHVRFIIAWFRALLTGRVAPSETVAGPIGIARLLHEGFQYGPSVFLRLLSYLSLSLGFLNLIPFPALDGSRVAFSFYELLRGKPIPPQREGLIHLIGGLILLAIMVIVTYQDIVRLFR